MITVIPGDVWMIKILRLMYHYLLLFRTFSVLWAIKIFKKKLNFVFSNDLYTSVTLPTDLFLEVRMHWLSHCLTLREEAKLLLMSNATSKACCSQISWPRTLSRTGRARVSVADKITRTRALPSAWSRVLWSRGSSCIIASLEERSLAAGGAERTAISVPRSTC